MQKIIQFHYMNMVIIKFPDFWTKNEKFPDSSRFSRWFSKFPDFSRNSRFSRLAGALKISVLVEKIKILILMSLEHSPQNSSSAKAHLKL